MMKLKRREKTGILLGIGLMAFFVCNGLEKSVLAHGEDRLGIHGGVIRMPGAFHVELKQLGRDRLALYLVDMEWKNPVTEASKLSAFLESGNGAPIPLSCKPVLNGPRFECETPKDRRLKRGDRVRVESQRKDQPGAPVVYEFPFRVGRAGGYGHHHGH